MSEKLRSYFARLTDSSSTSETEAIFYEVFNDRDLSAEEWGIALDVAGKCLATHRFGDVIDGLPEV